MSKEGRGGEDLARVAGERVLNEGVDGREAGGGVVQGTGSGLARGALDLGADVALLPRVGGGARGANAGELAAGLAVAVGCAWH